MAAKNACMWFLCAAVRESVRMHLLEADDDPSPRKHAWVVDERYAKVYNIDYGRASFAVSASEACPKDAI